MKHCTIIDNETGEIITEKFQIDTLEDKQRRKVAYEKSKIDNEFKEFQREHLGYFFFFLLNHINELINILTDSNVVRLFYLGSYIRTDGTIGYSNTKLGFTKNQLQDILKISNTAFKSFYKSIVSNNILIEYGNTYKINNKIFFKGKKSDYKKMTGDKLDSFTRLYIKTNRKLYEENYKYPKKLVMAYKLLPYTNWQHNILCTNVEETDIEKLDLINIGDVMNIFGYDKTNITKFKNNFYNIKFDKYPVFLSINKTGVFERSFIVVNPKISYRGNDLAKLQTLLDWFKIKEK